MKETLTKVRFLCDGTYLNNEEIVRYTRELVVEGTTDDEILMKFAQAGWTHTTTGNHLCFAVHRGWMLASE